MKKHLPLQIKSIDEENRIITGTATTPVPDRDGDIIEPKGATYTLPIPFLWQHKHDQPIGEVIAAQTDDNGITVTVKIAEIAEEGTLKDRIDQAWHHIRHGLVKGLSIGFRGKKYAYLEKGIHFQEWEWLELSAVTVPANPQAAIDTVKAAQTENTNPAKGKPMNIETQIQAVKTALQEKQTAIAAVLGAAAEQGQTPDDTQEQTIVGLENETAVLEKNLARLEKIKAAAEKAAQTAIPAAGNTEEEGKNTAAGIIKAQNLGEPDKGIPFAQYVRAKMVSALQAKEGVFVSPAQIAKAMKFSDPVVAYIEKATLGSTTDTGFAAPLVQVQTYTADFIELLRAKTVFNRIGGYRNVPFNVKINGQLTGGSSQWVGEGEKKPLTNPTFGSVEIKEHKLAAIVAYTQELLRRADPAIDVLIRDDLLASVAALIDQTFLDDQAQTDTRPAGILNGVTAVRNSGTTTAAYEKDLSTLITQFLENNLSTDGCYFLMSETRAMQMSLLRDPLGNTFFNGMGLSGNRSLMGLPVITSQAVGERIILIKPSEILVAQDGGIDVSYSDQATLTDGGATHHLWQENKFAMRVEKYITWAKRRPIAAGYISY